MTDQISHTGAWAIALIVIVVVSWYLYRYLVLLSQKAAWCRRAGAA